MRAKHLKLAGAWIALLLVAAWVRVQAGDRRSSNVLRPVLAGGSGTPEAVMEAIEQAIGRDRLARCGPLAMMDSGYRRVYFDVALDLEMVGPGSFAIRNPEVSSKEKGVRPETVGCIRELVRGSANVVLAVPPPTRRMTYSFCYGPMPGALIDGRDARTASAPDVRTRVPASP